LDTATGPSQAFLLKDDFATVSADEPAAEKLMFYPNPATDFIYLKGNTNRGWLDIRNTNGAVVFSCEIQNESINIGNLPPGFYIAELLKPDGQKITGKIIKM
jgi:hypothetical protein